MDDNKELENLSRTVFNKFRLEAPDNSWDKLDAELDKKQTVVYKQRANRFKLLSIVLLLIIFSFTTWHYLIPISTTKSISNVIAEKRAAINNASSYNIKAKNNSHSNHPSINLISSKNKNGFEEIKEKRQNHNRNKSQNEQLIVEVSTINNPKNNNSMQIEEQNDIADFINLPTYKIEDSVESNFTKANEISAEPKIFLLASTKTNSTEQHTLTSTISDIGFSQLIDSNKSEKTHFVENDLLLKKDQHLKSRVSLAAFYSPNQSWCNLKDNTNDYFDEVAMYNNRENSKFSFTTGLNLKFDLNNKWSLTTGAEYSTIAKSITIQTMYAKANAHNEIHFQYPTSNGVIEMPFDDRHPNLNPGDSINAKAVCSQSIQSINVPLTLRFQLTNKKFNWYTNTGVSANFIVQEKAKINMNNSEMTIINQINGLKKMNFSFLVSAGVQYNMHDDFSIFIEPIFRGSFSSITKNTNVNSYPYSLGLKIGFSQHF